MRSNPTRPRQAPTPRVRQTERDPATRTGSGSRSERRGRRQPQISEPVVNEWVSKTDFVRFLRCPYAFVQLDRGVIAAEELIDPLGEQLIEDGIQFHIQVLATAEPGYDETALEDTDGDATFMGLPVLYNRDRMLYGSPDGVRTAGGAMLPIEIKSHKDVQSTDLLELAFYWLLLDPHRTRGDVTPRGELILRRAGLTETVEVELDDEHFARVLELAEAVRAARRDGVKPRVCKCPACRGILREEVLRVTSACKDLSMIWGINRRADLLEALGIPDYEALVACDPGRVVTDLRARGDYVSALQVESWQLHALAYRCAAPVLFGPAAPVGDSFLTLDLEYDPMVSFIWLAGVLLCEGRRRTYTSLWADRESDQRHNLEALGDLIRAHPSLPVVTWAGTAADIPHLRTASQRCRLSEWLAPLHERHIDLCDHAVRTIRLPFPSLGLKDVASYFGIETTTTIADGREANVLFGRYQRSRNKATRRELREELVAYNRDDLDMLAQTHEALQGLHRRLATPTTRWYARSTQESLAAVISLPAAFPLNRPPPVSPPLNLGESEPFDQRRGDLPF